MGTYFLYNQANLQLAFSIFDKKKFNVVGYGAAAKTTTFLHYFDLSNTKQIKKIFDDNILKQNLYLPGTAIKILNPEYLDFKNVDIIIIFAWNYSDIIIQKIKKSIKNNNKNIKYLIPFPSPKIVK